MRSTSLVLTITNKASLHGLSGRFCHGLGAPEPRQSRPTGLPSGALPILSLPFQLILPPVRDLPTVKTRLHQTQRRPWAALVRGGQAGWGPVIKLTASW
jgi:hypothetical protein